MILRPVLISSFMLVLAVSAIAQTFHLQKEDWRTIKPEIEEFAVDSPVELKTVGNNDPDMSRAYLGQTNGTFLCVFSDPLRTPEYLKVVQGVAKSSGKVLEVAEALLVQNHIGFKDESGYYHHILGVRTVDRIYLAQTISPSDDDPAVIRFLSSFEVGNKKAGVSFKPNELPSIPVSDPKTKSPNIIAGVPPVGKVPGSGNGNGSGTGAGNGSNSTVPTVAKDDPILGVTSPLKLLSKPRPGYTRLARIYEIEGTVMTKVVFLASGSIGQVNVTKKLPFGLTESAIAAARQISFEPKRINGTPVSVIKQVEYTFSLY